MFQVRHGPGKAEIGSFIRIRGAGLRQTRDEGKGEGEEESGNGASRRGTAGSQTSPFLDFSLAR